MEAFPQIGALANQLHCLQSGAGDRGRQRVREEVRARPLAEELHDLCPRTSESAGRAAERLAERTGDDVHTAKDAVMFGRPAPLWSDEPGGMAVIDHDQRVMA